MERVSRCVFVATLYCVSGITSADADMSDLERKLKTIERQLDELEPDRAKLESECLKLLDQYSSPQDKGKIYGELVMVYSKKGMSDPDKMIEYGEKAMEFPLEPTQACKACSAWASGLKNKHLGKGGEEFAVARREIALPLLRGLKVCLEQDLPAERQAPPSVHGIRHSGPPDDPGYLALLKKHDEQMAARERIMLQNDLILYRDSFLQRIVRDYSRKPEATDELRDLAREILENEEAVQDLVARVDAKIAESPKPAQGKDTQE